MRGLLLRKPNIKCEPMPLQDEAYMTDTDIGDESACKNSNLRTQYMVNDEFVNETTDYNMF